MTTPDPRPGITRFVETWRRAAAAGATRRDLSRDLAAFGELTLAAERARLAYPGPVGLLVAREILAYGDLGHRFDRTGLIPELVAELLADDPCAEVRLP